MSETKKPNTIKETALACLSTLVLGGAVSAICLILDRALIA